MATHLDFPDSPRAILGWLGWGAGYSNVSEEDDNGGDPGAGDGAITRTYLAGLGEVSGSICAWNAAGISLDPQPPHFVMRPRINHNI